MKAVAPLDTVDTREDTDRRPNIVATGQVMVAGLGATVLLAAKGAAAILADIANAISGRGGIAINASCWLAHFHGLYRVRYGRGRNFLIALNEFAGATLVRVQI